MAGAHGADYNPIIGTWMFSSMSAASDTTGTGVIQKALASRMQGTGIAFTLNSMKSIYASGRIEAHPIEKYTIENRTVTVWAKLPSGREGRQSFTVKNDGGTLILLIPAGLLHLTAYYARAD